MEWTNPGLWSLMAGLWQRESGKSSRLYWFTVSVLHTNVSRSALRFCLPAVVRGGSDRKTDKTELVLAPVTAVLVKRHSFPFFWYHFSYNTWIENPPSVSLNYAVLSSGQFWVLRQRRPLQVQCIPCPCSLLVEWVMTKTNSSLTCTISLLMFSENSRDPRWPVKH